MVRLADEKKNFLQKATRATKRKLAGRLAQPSGGSSASQSVFSARRPCQCRAKRLPFLLFKFLLAILPVVRPGRRVPCRRIVGRNLKLGHDRNVFILVAQAVVGYDFVIMPISRANLAGLLVLLLPVAAYPAVTVTVNVSSPLAAVPAQGIGVGAATYENSLADGSQTVTVPKLKIAGVTALRFPAALTPTSITGRSIRPNRAFRPTSTPTTPSPTS